MMTAVIGLLFSSSGRINRAKYWLSLSVYVFLFLIWFVYFAIGVGVVSAASSAEKAVKYVTFATLIVLLVAFAWSNTVTGIKRLHDCDKSGWWILAYWGINSAIGLLQSVSGEGIAMALNVATVTVEVWIIIELGVMRGTSGPNQYGPDPLEWPSNEPLR